MHSTSLSGEEREDADEDGVVGKESQPEGAFLLGTHQQAIPRGETRRRRQTMKRLMPARVSNIGSNLLIWLMFEFQVGQQQQQHCLGVEIKLVHLQTSLKRIRKRQDLVSEMLQLLLLTVTDRKKSRSRSDHFFRLGKWTFR